MRGLLLLLVGTFGAAAWASTLYVNPQGNDAWDGLCEQWDGATCGPKRTIQAGIDAAQPGDTVKLAPAHFSGPGNYDIRFRGKGITVEGVPGWAVQVGGLGRGFVFDGGEDETAILRRVSISGGEATLGGAIACISSSPRIEYCHIGESHAAVGGGIYCADSMATFVGCVVHDNSADWDGGGCYTANASAPSPVSLVSCTFLGNSARWYGGGICVNAGTWIADCDIHDNVANGAGADSCGGGITSLGSSVRVYSCRIFNNFASGTGGGVCARSSAEVTLSRIAGNSARWGGGIGSIGSIGLIGCIIDYNFAAARGSAVFVEEYASCDIQGCTLTGNENANAFNNSDLVALAPAFGAPIRHIYNSILWGDRHDGGFTPMWCDIQGYPADNSDHIINADPRFMNAAGPDGDPAAWEDNDYRLRADSPCIDKGTLGIGQWQDSMDIDGDGDYAEPWPYDYDGFARTFGAGLDMGAFENHAGDMNCDGAVTFADIDPFVAALSGPDAWPNPACPWVNGDCTGDANVTFGDIDPFVARLGQ